MELGLGLGLGVGGTVGVGIGVRVGVGGRVEGRLLLGRELAHLARLRSWDRARVGVMCMRKRTCMSMCSLLRARRVTDRLTDRLTA